MLRALGALALRSAGGRSGSGALAAWGGALPPILGALPHALTNPWLLRLEGEGQGRRERELPKPEMAEEGPEAAPPGG